MDENDFGEFFRRHERREELLIDPEKLKAIISRLLSEFNLDLWYTEKTGEGDIAAVAIDKLDRDIISLVRIIDAPTSVDKEDLEDLYESMEEENARVGIYLTTFHFTKEAREYAQHMPIRLVDGIELGALLEEYVAEPGIAAFLSSETDSDVVEYFKRRGGKKALGIIGVEERMEGIDRRYIPMAAFSFSRMKGNAEEKMKVYVDLHMGDMFHLEERNIRKVSAVKRVLDLPEESREHLLDLLRHGKLRREHMEGKHLDILEKEGLVDLGKGTGEASIFKILSDELSDTMSVVAHEAKDLASTTSSSPRTAESRYSAAGGQGYVSSTLKIPSIDESYNLGHFIESGENDERFDADAVTYSKDDVLEVLNGFYGETVCYEKMIYFPYYMCEYRTLHKVRHEVLLTPKFNELIPEKSGFYEVYKLIDEAPVVPYLGLGLGYAIYQWNNPNHLIHLFSSAFIFFMVSVAVGLVLKVVFRTERRVPRYGGPVLRYGFPSIHTMSSVGGVSFAYFVHPVFALALLPLALLYLYSRLSLGVHEVSDVIGGSVAGLILGYFCGKYVYLAPPLDHNLELAFAVLFFIVPVVGNMLSSSMR